MTITNVEEARNVWPEIPIGQASDITNQKFNFLTARYRTYNSKNDRHPIWVCECDCGNFTPVAINNLKKNHTKSCGCYKILRTKETNFKDITGLQSGFLVALEPTDKRDGSYVVWKCKCTNCNSICYVRSSHLIAQAVKSCGCVMSHGELEIKKLLNKLNISFQEQYIFNDLKYKSNLRFDFAIFNNNTLKGLIEFQGIQHYKKTGYGDNQRLITDQLKKDYCQQHNIPLYEIKYNEDIKEALCKILGDLL